MKLHKVDENIKQEVDRKTSKAQNMYTGLYPIADIHRLYLPKRMDGRGVKEVKSTIQAEKQVVDEYVWVKKDL